jgi:hypothetical protein
MTDLSIAEEIRRLERLDPSPWIALTPVFTVDVVSALMFLASLE